jgi:hypothetical protein
MNEISTAKWIGEQFGLAALLLVMVLVGIFFLGRYVARQLLDADKGLMVRLVNRAIENMDKMESVLGEMLNTMRASQVIATDTNQTVKAFDSRFGAEGKEFMTTITNEMILLISDQIVAHQSGDEARVTALNQQIRDLAYGKQKKD